MENINKSMVDFIKKLSEDQALSEKMSKAANPEEAYGIAKENGVAVSFDEFKDTMKVLAATAKGELSEEEMQAVAGGLSKDQVVELGGIAAGLAITLGTAGIGLAAVAAA